MTGSARGAPSSGIAMPLAPDRFGRPVKSSAILPAFLSESARIGAFAPPFRFTQFFSPEDTLLCVCAAETAISHLRGSTDERIRVAELTTGSGLVGLDLLLFDHETELVALDVDDRAITTASANARLLGLSSRARFECADLWSDDTMASLRSVKPHLVICNPPYVPEPDDAKLQVEAGAGADGTAHLKRTIELIETVRPDAAALSWCSLSDPGAVVAAAARAGYRLRELFIVAIADGEYSGSVRDYLRTLPHAYVCETAEALHAVAPDGSARFAYLLLSGVFARFGESQAEPHDHAARDVQRLCESFATHGLNALIEPLLPIPVRCWLLDRWDELRLRALLH